MLTDRVLCEKKALLKNINKANFFSKKMGYSKDIFTKLEPYTSGAFITPHQADSEGVMQAKFC